MYLSQLSLTHYRNYTRLKLELEARVNVFQGDNAQGKTNLLEVIFYLATTRSPRASSDRQLIQWNAYDEVIPFARIEGTYVRGGGAQPPGEEHTIEVTLALEQRGDSPEATFRRQIRLDGAPRRAMDVLGKLNAVLFLPEDISLVSGSPSHRRRYLDVMLCQIDTRYCRSLSRYNRVLSQRNALLRQIRGRSAGADELAYWDAQLAELGSYVLARRLWAVAVQSPMADRVQRALSGGKESLSLVYKNTLDMDHTGDEGLAKPIDASSEGNVESAADLREAFVAALRAVRQEERSRGVTLVGPHRDDLRFLLGTGSTGDEVPDLSQVKGVNGVSLAGIDATRFGSRGQQRTVALALKLAEVQLIHDTTGEMPILLLDDVLSELDKARSRYLLETISHAEQVLITTTDLGDCTPEILGSACLWEVSGGDITPMDSEQNCS